MKRKKNGGRREKRLRGGRGKLRESKEERRGKREGRTLGGGEGESQQGKKPWKRMRGPWLREWKKGKS
ncbi:hypothetical protein, partial [Streptococcus pyogenes]|uniref:hypothetical protein n=1 Tax=Streptococcus pyogenes TaxID=1314 RepID=UPI0011E83A48